MDVSLLFRRGLLVAVCLGLSAVTYWTIERPFLRRKARLRWWIDEHRAARSEFN